MRYEITFRRIVEVDFGIPIKEEPIIKSSMLISERELQSMYNSDREFITERVLDKLVDRIKDGLSK